MPPSLTVSPLSIEIEVGETFQLTVTPGANGVKWGCTVCNVATVSNSGLVTGLAAGEATIIARRGNTTVEISVTVVAVTPTPPPPDPPTVQLQVFSGATADDEWQLITDGTAPAPGDTFASSSIDFGDGSAAINYPGAPPEAINHTWPSDGTYTVTLIVTAVLGGSAQTTLGITVPPGPTPPDPPPPDIAPTAAIAFVSGQYTGSSILFTTAGTFDQDGSITSHEVDYGDGTVAVASGAPETSLTHVYASPGTYTVRLTVTDNVGLSGSATTTAVIQDAPTNPQPPIAKLAIVTGYYAGDTFAFSTSGTGDPDGTLTGGSFTTGTGQTQAWTGPPPALFNATYPSAGTFTATMIVTDNSGLSTSVSVTVTVVTAPSGQPHTRFDALRALPQHFSSYGLRSQAELNSLTNAGVSTRYTYDAGEDAAKLIWPETIDSIEGNQQLKLPIHQTSGTFLFTWDTKYGSEWRSIANGGVIQIAGYNHKEFQIRMSPGGAGAGAITLETRNRLGLAPTAADISMIDNRLYMSPTNPIGMTDAVPPTPSGLGAVAPDTIPVKHSVWNRYVEEVRLNLDASAFVDWMTLTGLTLAAGTYHMYSVWLLDPTRGPLRIVFRIPIDRNSPIRDGISAFNFEHNTSSHDACIGPLTLHSRDWVCLKNFPLDGASPETNPAYALIFERP